MTPVQKNELVEEMKKGVIEHQSQSTIDYLANKLAEAQAERDVLQAECDALRRGHDKIHQRIDRALAALQESKQPALGQSFWRAMDKMVATQNEAIKILTGEGE